MPLGKETLPGPERAVAESGISEVPGAFLGSSLPLGIQRLLGPERILAYARMSEVPGAV